MTDKLKPLVPMVIGGVIAVVLFFFPEAKPVACGGVAVLPSLLAR